VRKTFAATAAGFMIEWVVDVCARQTHGPTHLHVGRIDSAQWNKTTIASANPLGRCRPRRMLRPTESWMKTASATTGTGLCCRSRRILCASISTVSA
jgi:hypothetical protein